MFTPHDPEAKRRSKRYGRMFTGLIFGLVFFVTGTAGLSLSRADGGPKWVGRPVLWQVAVGLGMMALGIYWSRRLDDPRLQVHAGPRREKHVGTGRSPGAARRRLPR